MVGDLANKLQKNRVTVRLLLERGETPGVKIGNRWYVTREELRQAAGR
jgi:hypothetical protein